MGTSVTDRGDFWCINSDWRFLRAQGHRGSDGVFLIPPMKGKSWGMIAGSCTSTPVLTTGVCCWLWDLLCGSRSARKRWDPPDKVGWEHLFQQTEQSVEECLKLWATRKGYNEPKSNDDMQDWVGERRVQYGMHKSKEALASRMCTKNMWHGKWIRWTGAQRAVTELHHYWNNGDRVGQLIQLQRCDG